MLSDWRKEQPTRLQIKQPKEHLASVLVFRVRRCVCVCVCVCVPQMVCKLCRKCAGNKAPTQRYFHGGLLLLIPPRRFHIVGFVLDSLPCSPPLPPAKYAEQNVASMPHATWQPDKTCRQNLTQLCTRPSPFLPLPATSF